MSLLTLGYIVTFAIFIKAYWFTKKDTKAKARWLFVTMLAYLGLCIGEVARPDPSTILIVMSGVNAILSAVNMNLVLKIVELEENTKRMAEWRNKLNG